MKKTKDSKGITLVSLIITIIIMFLLVGVTTYTGINSYNNAKVTRFTAQMQLIQKRVDEISNDEDTITELISEKQNNITVLDKAHQNEEIPFDDSINYDLSYKNQFKLFTIQDLKDDLDLENIDTDVLINFNTREVVAINGIEYKGKTYYTQYKLPQGQTLVATNYTRSGNIDFTINKQMDGLNCLITITNAPSNCKLIYGEGETVSDVSNWNTISEYTKTNENYTLNISKSGTYIFKLQDNTNETSIVSKTVIIATTNSPKTQLEVSNYDYALDSTYWASVTDQEENEYVWIPRFAYKYNLQEDKNDIKFIKGNSNIATDNTYVIVGNGENQWSIPNIFTSDNKQLTGIWVVKSQNLSFDDIIDETITEGLET